MLVIFTIFLMAITPRSAPTPAPIIAAATTGPYTLANAQAQGYVAPAASGGNSAISFTAPIPVAPSINLGGGAAYSNSSTPGVVYSSSAAASNKINTPGTTYYNTPPASTPPASTPPASTPPKTSSPLKLDLSPIQRTQVGNIASQFSSAISSAKGDRSMYNSSINYDGMNANRKRIADNLFDRNNLPKKEEVPYDENPINTAEKLRQTEENKKQQELLDQQSKDATTENNSNKLVNDSTVDQASNSITTERDKTLAEQETLAKSGESNRLNQMIGNIMTRLAQGGVDISRLSPEQITALSGEEGSKAFMDVADIKDRKTKTIESVRQSALSKLNELRDKKSLNQTNYNSRVNEINSKTAAAKLQAEKEFGTNVFALSQTREQQSRSDALARVNAAQTYLTAAGVSGPVAANAIANLTSRGLPDATIKSIAQSPAFIKQLKDLQEANLAAAQRAAAIAISDAEAKTTTANARATSANAAVTNANRPRSAGSGSGIHVTFDNANI